MYLYDDLRDASDAYLLWLKREIEARLELPEFYTTNMQRESLEMKLGRVKQEIVRRSIERSHP